MHVMGSSGFGKVAYGKSLEVGRWAVGFVMQDWVNRAERQGGHKNSVLIGADTEPCLWHSDETRSVDHAHHIYSMLSPRATWQARGSSWNMVAFGLFVVCYIAYIDCVLKPNCVCSLEPIRASVTEYEDVGEQQYVRRPCPVGGGVALCTPKDRPPVKVISSGGVNRRTLQLGSKNNRATRIPQISSEIWISMMSGWRMSVGRGTLLDVNRGVVRPGRNEPWQAYGLCKTQTRNQAQG